MSCIRWKWVESLECWLMWSSIISACGKLADDHSHWLWFQFGPWWPSVLVGDSHFATLFTTSLTRRANWEWCFFFLLMLISGHYRLYFDTIVWHYVGHISLLFSWALGPGELKQFPSLPLLVAGLWSTSLLLTTFGHLQIHLVICETQALSPLSSFP